MNRAKLLCSHWRLIIQALATDVLQFARQAQLPTFRNATDTIIGLYHG